MRCSLITVKNVLCVAAVFSLVYIGISSLQAQLSPDIFSVSTYDAESMPNAVIPADLDGQNGPDLVVVNTADNNVSVLLNDGTGRFDMNTPPDVRVGSEPVTAAAADLDGQNGLDLVVVNRGGNNVTVLLNDGNALMNDGDVAFNRFFVSVLEENEGGEEGDEFRADRPVSVVIDDLDGQRGPDVAIANFSGEQTTISVLLNWDNALSRFESTEEYSVGFGSCCTIPMSIAAGDWDGDGDNDLAVAWAGIPDTGPDTISILENTGLASGVFEEQFPMDLSILNLLIGDVNCPGTGAIGDDDFECHTLSLIAADLNNDNNVDLAVSVSAILVSEFCNANPEDFFCVDHTPELANSVFVFLKTGMGLMDFAAPQRYEIQDGADGRDPLALTVADLDGDCDPDLAVANHASNSVTVLFNDGSGAFLPEQQDFDTEGEGPSAIAAADLDRNGMQDLLVTNRDSNTVSVLLNNPMPQTGLEDKFGVFLRGSWMLDGNGNGRFDGCDVNGDRCARFGVSDDVPVVGDWDGNGTDELGIFREGIWALDGNGNGRFDGCDVNGDRCVRFGVSDDVPVVGDWDGNGTDELGIFREGVWALDGNGNGRFDGCGVNGDRCVRFGVSDDVPVVGDWDGNGTDELGIFREGVWALDGNGNSRFDGCGVNGDRCVRFGVSDDVPVVGNWDGHCRDELGIFREGIWALDGNGNGRFDGCGVNGDRCMRFGVGDDRPVVGQW